MKRSRKKEAEMTEVFGLHTAVCVLAEEEGKEEFDAGWDNLQWTKYTCSCTHAHVCTHTHRISGKSTELEMTLQG